MLLRVEVRLKDQAHSHGVPAQLSDVDLTFSAGWNAPGPHIYGFSHVFQGKSITLEIEGGEALVYAPSSKSTRIDSVSFIP